MPIFEFVCQKCHSTSEQFIRSNEKPVCPECESRDLSKLISAPFGHVAAGTARGPSMGCPPADAPPCNPNCCRLPQ